MNKQHKRYTLLCWRVQLHAWEGQEATAHALAR
jgi:hypothetical protein